MKIISTIALATSALLACVSCDDNGQFAEEQYKKVIYLLSEGNSRVFPGIHKLDEPVSTGYVTVASGGTNLIDENVTVEFERDDSLLNAYNKTNFDIDTEKYAKELDPSRFDIQSYSLTMKTGSENPYALLPIRVYTEGLSPDSTYFIPLRIKSVSNYEVNPKYNAVLYRVYLENDYAQQKEKTVYTVRGERQVGNGVVAKVTLDKRAYPITKDQIRIFADTKNSSEKLDEINRYSILLQIKQDSTISITSYKPEFLQVEQLNINEGDNRIRPDVLGVYRTYIHYKYRTRATTQDEFEDEWTTMNLNMKRVE